MSDIGLFPPGAFAWFCALALLAIAGVVFVICVFISWLRTRRSESSWKADRFSGYAIGAAATALASALSIWLINWSGSLGAFSHWIDRTAAAASWILLLVAFWPVVAFAWNRRFKRRP